ncbi:MAG: iron-sulfur cluster assembly accessory protein [Cytophagales bacterium]|nr:MAG: iron-sulfur cluster assembly accessory protein [Cytophagales bacterium]
MLDFSFCPVEFSSTAQKEIKNIYFNKNIPSEYGLRIGVEGGGCSAVNYIIGFDQPTEHDKIYLLEGIKVLIAQKHQMYLFGIRIEYHSNETMQGFEFMKT